MDLLLSDNGIVQKSYEVDKLLENPKERRTLDLSENSQSKNSVLKQRLMNAAGRIQLLRGVHGTFASCESGDSSADCMLSVGEIGFSFLSNAIEDGILKITPKGVKLAAGAAGKVPGALGKNLKFAIQLKGMKFGKVVARGVAGG